MKVLSLHSQIPYSNPTYKEVKTDENKYILGQYVCVDYAKDDVNNNAEKQGIRCAFVWVRFEGMM